MVLPSLATCLLLPAFCVSLIPKNKFSKYMSCLENHCGNALRRFSTPFSMYMFWISCQTEKELFEYSVHENEVRRRCFLFIVSSPDVKRKRCFFNSKANFSFILWLCCHFAHNSDLSTHCAMTMLSIYFFEASLVFGTASWNYTLVAAFETSRYQGKCYLLHPWAAFEECDGLYHFKLLSKYLLRRVTFC